VGRLLLVAFLIALAGLALFSSAGIALLWRLRRKNRLHPKWPTLAPTIWLWHPAKPARLHRRLRAACATAHFRLPGRGRHKVPHSSVDELIGELMHEAIAVDEQVVLAGRAPRAIRRQLLNVTEPQVAKLEAIAGRLAVLVSASARPGGAPAANAILALEDRLDAIEVSRQEIADLEAALFLDLAAAETDADAGSESL
jgi:hypothetical protein